MRYRVITSNANGSISIMTDWLTRAECRRFIVGRWGHCPPWAHISSSSSYDFLKRAYGDE